MKNTMVNIISKPSDLTDSFDLEVLKDKLNKTHLFPDFIQKIHSVIETDDKMTCVIILMFKDKSGDLIWGAYPISKEDLKCFTMQDVPLELYEANLYFYNKALRCKSLGEQFLEEV